MEVSNDPLIGRSVSNGIIKKRLKVELDNQGTYVVFGGFIIFDVLILILFIYVLATQILKKNIIGISLSSIFILLTIIIFIWLIIKLIQGSKKQWFQVDEYGIKYTSGNEMIIDNRWDEITGLSNDSIRGDYVRFQRSEENEFAISNSDVSLEELKNIFDISSYYCEKYGIPIKNVKMKYKKYSER